jgi:serine/threonine-protein kinase
MSPDHPADAPPSIHFEPVSDTLPQASDGAADQQGAGPVNAVHTVPETPEAQEQAGERKRAWTGEFVGGDGDELVGQTLCGTYVIERVLGEGGMGRVYEARHTRIRAKRYAVKTLHPEFMRNPEAVARFRREAEAAASITSPHVVGVYDVDEAPDGRPFIVSEYLDGRELGALLEERGRLPIPLTLGVVRQVCRALQTAHDNGVVHRDVKPENVFLVGDLDEPVAKVLDFGISRLDDGEGSKLTQTGYLMGTPSYMSPEQARGQRVDHRTDVYAVGVMLYTMLTGRLPFDRADPAATIAAVLTEEPPRPRAIDPAIPERLELVVQRAMAREIGKRFDTMADLELALESASDGSFTPLSNVPSLPRSAGVSRTRSMLATALGTVGDARASLATMLALCLLAVGAGFASAASGVVASLDVQLSGVELALVLVAGGGLLATPMLLALRRLRGNVWGNTVAVIELGQQLRIALVAGLALYGGGALLVQLMEGVVLARPFGAAWPAWSVVLFVLASIAAVVAARFEARRQRGDAVASPWLASLPLTVAGSVLLMTVVVTTSLAREPGAPGADSRAVGSDASDDATAAASASASASPSASASAAANVASLRKQILARAGDAESRGDALVLAAELFAAAPSAAGDEQLQRVVLDAAGQPATADAAFDLMKKHMRAHGPDLLYQLLTTKPALAKRAGEALEQSSVIALGTPALRVAFELHRAKSCGAKAKLLDRAKREGDERAAAVLRPLMVPRKRGCGILGLGACPPRCPAQASKMRAAVKAIAARTGG